MQNKIIHIRPQFIISTCNNYFTNVVVSFVAKVVIDCPLGNGTKMETMLVPERVVWFAGVEGDGRALKQRHRHVLVAPEESVFAAVVRRAHPPLLLVRIPQRIFMKIIFFLILKICVYYDWRRCHARSVAPEEFQTPLSACCACNSLLVRLPTISVVEILHLITEGTFFGVYLRENVWKKVEATTGDCVKTISNWV